MSDENATAPEVGHVLPILQVPDPRLKTRSRRVTPADRDRIAELVPAMFRTMYAAPGIGLAAPQVGEPLRLVVVDVAPEGEHNPLVLINPEVASAGGEPSTREEGCLSIPGVYADVTRPGSVTVRYEDEDGAKHTIEADGLLAACLQHEIDHLDGILFLDHLSALKRNMLLRRLAKERRQKASA